MRIRRLLRCVVACSLALGVLAATGVAQAQGVLIPGTGIRMDAACDDFEDPDWKYHHNGPKASEEIDENVRAPLGRSANGYWIESTLRGHPDVVMRIATPPGGLEGSEGALLLRTRLSGIPGRVSGQHHQDDFLLNATAKLRGWLPTGWSPSFVCRVYLPPFEQWEQQTGNSFGLRAGARGRKPGSSGGLFSSSRNELEPYWPGLFIYFNSKHDRRFNEDSAYFIIRGQQSGRDYRGPDIKELGWWTMGMSFTPDGRVHYFASPGIDDLTAEDHLASQYPYGFKCERFMTLFFNICNQENGRNWSTPWVIDDPEIFVATAPQQAQRPATPTRRRSR